MERKPMRLSWQDVELLGQRLAELYPSRDPLQLRSVEIARLVRQLPEFWEPPPLRLLTHTNSETPEADSLSLVAMNQTAVLESDCLEGIQMAWYERRHQLHLTAHRHAPLLSEPLLAAQMDPIPND